MAIQWVFFDVGNVLFNDDPQTYEVFRRYHRELAASRPDYAFEDLLASREALAAKGESWILYKLVKDAISRERLGEIYAETRAWTIERYDDHHLMDDDLPALLEGLRSRYRLGIIANQPPECRASLSRRGLLGKFDVVAISEEIDRHKPDPAIFTWALEQAGADPAASIMIGDRRDNDVAPAKKLGMRTIWLRAASDAVRQWRPTDPLAQAFLASIRRVPLFQSIESPENQADREVGRLHDVPEAVDAIAAH